MLWILDCLPHFERIARAESQSYSLYIFSPHTCGVLWYYIRRIFRYARSEQTILSLWRQRKFQPKRNLQPRAPMSGCIRNQKASMLFFSLFFSQTQFPFDPHYAPQNVCEYIEICLQNTCIVYVYIRNAASMWPACVVAAAVDIVVVCFRCAMCVFVSSITPNRYCGEYILRYAGHFNNQQQGNRHTQIVW